MTKFELRRRYLTVTYLLACALNDVTPDAELIPKDHVEGLYQYAKHHSVGALVTTALEKIGLAPANAVMERNMAIRKVMLLDAGRAEIFARFEAEGIKYMPLKGVIIKDMYPAIGLRQMADNDILFDPEYRLRVKEIMLELGYTTSDFMRTNHDVYYKEPIYNYEMHASLFELSNRKTFAEYFCDVFGAGIKDSGNSYGYHMSDEYYYLYLKAHEYKHHTNGGTGIRSLLDTYVFLREKEKLLDREHLDAELAKLEILDYERDTRDLAFKIFDVDFSEKNLRSLKGRCQKSKGLLSDDECIFLDNFFMAGTYGTMVTLIKNELDKCEKEKGRAFVKVKYVFSKVFRNADFYRSHYPRLCKHDFFIPLAAVCRIFEMIFLRPKSSFKLLSKVIRFRRKKKSKK